MPMLRTLGFLSVVGLLGTLAGGPSEAASGALTASGMVPQPERRVAEAPAMTGEAILAKMDLNRDYKTTTFKGGMKIYVGDKLRVKTFTAESIIEGRKSIVEFTNPEDKGTRYLMLGDQLWIYFPEEDDVVKISGHMLKEGMMGSDVSYEDALTTAKLSDQYTVKVTGKETLEGRECYVLSLEAKVKDVSYVKRTMWVDTETFIQMKEDLFASSGKLLKSSRVLETRKVGNRTMAARTEMRDMLKKDTKTVFEMNDATFDTPLAPERFTRQALSR